jgi:hypothetical protein
MRPPGGRQRNCPDSPGFLAGLDGAAVNHSNLLGFLRFGPAPLYGFAARAGPGDQGSSRMRSTFVGSRRRPPRGWALIDPAIRVLGSALQLVAKDESGPSHEPYGSGPSGDGRAPSGSCCGVRHCAPFRRDGGLGVEVVVVLQPAIPSWRSAEPFMRSVTGCVRSGSGTRSRSHQRTGAASSRRASQTRVLQVELARLDDPQHELEDPPSAGACGAQSATTISSRPSSESAGPDGSSRL